MSVLLIGESLINKITAPDGSTRLTPGGAMLNVAIGLRHLGRTTRLVTDFGLDANGRILAEYAASNGLELWLRADGERTNPTSVSHVSLDASGSASYSFDFTWDIQDKPFSGACKLDLDLLDPQSLAFGSAACHLQPGAAKVRNWVEELRENVTVFYDPNVRPALLGDIREARAVVESFAGYADVVKSSDEDIALVYGPNASIEEVAGRWLESGVLLAVVTCGSEGALMYSAAGETIHVPARQVDVVNSSGAGELGDSRRIRGGSRFHIRLPPRRQSAHARGAGSRLRRLQLFDIRRSLRRTLREASPKPVVAAPSGPVPPAAPARRRPLTSSRRPTQRPLPGSLERRAHRADFPQRTALRTR